MKKSIYIALIEMMKYGFWGVVTTTINLILFYIMIRLRMYYLISNVLSYAVAVILSYYLNNRFVFKNQEKGRKVRYCKLIKFIIIRVLSIGLDSILLLISVDYLGINLMLSKISVSFFIIILTFMANKLFVFNTKGAKNISSNKELTNEKLY